MSNASIGHNIRMLRENAGFTQSSLAAFAGVDQSLISKVEKGERGLSAEALKRLADLFGISLDEIEQENAVAPSLSFAFRGSELSLEEMRAVSEINRIALNAEFMSALLEECE